MSNMRKILSAFIAIALTATTSFAAVAITTTSKTFAKEGGAASVSTGAMA